MLLYSETIESNKRSKRNIHNFQSVPTCENMKYPSSQDYWQALKPIEFKLVRVSLFDASQSIQYSNLILILISLYYQIPIMNYFFTPFPIIDQYQPFYSFVPQMFIETKTYYTEEPILEKQISILKSQNSTLEPQLPSKSIDQHVSSYRKTKKTKKREDKNFGFREQDKQRNIFSNILKGFFVALSQKRAMDAFIRQTQLGNEAHLDLEKFHTKVFQIFKKCKSYFSPKSVRQILKLEKDEEGVRNIVKRCLYQYLKTQFSINLLLSKRIKRKSKLLQMKKARQLLSILRENQ